ncbi:hypothetical protein L9F63_015100 [Diploptera punctata]|uniref:Activator of basal transcription 1 n=1 Tax=Diploptera punctata TaxID=6984 RepID=A0AAD8EKC7_DIPPU|nr:hypothetical protein L9F63_015100 [Diploptera punctata]
MSEWQIEDVDISSKKDSDGDSDKLETNEENVERNGVKGGLEKKKKKCGIIYISTLPKYMNVTKVREIFGSYGEIDRVYLQPTETGDDKKKKKKFAKHFTEGWVEFKSKRVAKQVALQLNTTRIEERKRSKFYDHFWSIKYLPRFKWVHLTERLAYERAVHKQRLRNEISQVKREANFISHNFEQSQKLKRKINSSENIQTSPPNSFLQNYHQRKTDREIFEENATKTNTTSEEESDRKTFLRNLFGQ